MALEDNAGPVVEWLCVLVVEALAVQGDELMVVADSEAVLGLGGAWAVEEGGLGAAAFGHEELEVGGEVGGGVVGEEGAVVEAQRLAGHVGVGLRPTDD